MSLSSDVKASAEKSSHGRLFLPVLGLSVFSAWLITVTFQLLLVDIAATFQVDVGIAGLVASVGSLSGIAAGLLLAVLSIRFNHKLFLMIGLACTSLATIGFFLAPTFSLMLTVNIGVGSGIAMTTAMAYSFVGESYPLEKRGRAMGWIVASSTLAFVVGAPVIGIIANVANWRFVMIWLVLPIAIASLILAYLIIPNKSVKNKLIHREPFLAGCKQVFNNRSATASLLVTMFTVAEASIAFYTVSFFREQFIDSIEIGSMIVLVGSILSAVGGVTAGLFVNRIGRKPLGTFTCLIAAILTLTFTFMPDFTVSWAMNALRFWFAGMSSTALGSLIIEQIPNFRATMASLNATFVNIGMLLASLSGGLALSLFSYQTMGLVFGSLGVVGVFLWVALVKDPTRTNN